LAILEKEIEISWNVNSKEHYILKGYIFTKYRDKFIVKIENLSKGSNVKVTKICDDCGKIIPNQKLISILNKRENGGNGRDRCFDCASIYSGKKRRENMSSENSLKYFAIINEKGYLLAEYSNKNDRKPEELHKNSHDVVIWNCQRCKSEYQMKVKDRTNKYECNCPYCSGRRVNHTNCLWATHPDVAKLLKDKNRGFKITAGRLIKEEFICSDCGNLELKPINNVVRNGFRCSKCSDGVSYPEKVIYNLLQQSNTKFEKEKVFDWSKGKKRTRKGEKRYDFFIEKLNCIIEVHGEQHYTGSFEALDGRSLESEKENDRFKERLAKENGIENYIILDCRKSELEYIKENVLSSDIVKLINLSMINWEECHKNACNSIVKVVCDLWNKGIKNTKTISEITNLSRSTAIRYLKQGAVIGWCDYNPEEMLTKRKVVQLTLSGDLINEWECISDCTIQFENKNILGHISSVCNGKRISAGGYRWLYKEDYERYERDNDFKNNIDNQSSRHKPHKRKVINIDTKEIFNSAAETSAIYNVHPSSISAACKGKCLIKGCRFMYYDDYINDKVELENRLNLKGGYGVEIICLTTNEEFSSIKKAEEIYNISSTNIGLCCKFKRKSAGKHPETKEKMIWMYKEDYEKYIAEQKELTLT
jgi:hypothetical protein